MAQEIKYSDVFAYHPSNLEHGLLVKKGTFAYSNKGEIIGIKDGVRFSIPTEFGDASTVLSHEDAELMAKTLLKQLKTTKK